MNMERTQRIEELAGQWLARRDSPNWTPDEQQALQAWLDESLAHRVAYLRLETAWESAARIKALGAGRQSEVPPPPGDWHLSPFFTQRALETHARLRTSTRLISALAGSVAIAIISVCAWHWWPTANSFSTPVGGVTALPMADGSQVTLNSNSAIRVAITAEERRIDLKHGEAFFEVAKDSKRPFVVTVGDQRVVAIGTKFSVRRADTSDSIQVVVTEGVVRVDLSKDLSSASARPLTAGAVALVNHDGLMIQQMKLPEAEERLSWRTGMLIFRDATLADAAREFNRYNERQTVIDDPTVAALRISGNFRMTQVDAFVRLLEQGYPVQTTATQHEIIVRSR